MTKKATDFGDPGVERDVRNSWVVYIYLGTIDIVPFIEMLYVHFGRESSTCLTPNIYTIQSLKSSSNLEISFKSDRIIVLNWSLCAPSPLSFWTFLSNVPSALCPSTSRGGVQQRRAGRTKGQEAWEAINPSLWTWSLDADSMTAEQGPAEWNYLRLERF